MKKGLLATTALIGAGALMAGAAGAAEAPDYKLSGNMNFQFYWVNGDAQAAVDNPIFGGDQSLFDTTATDQDHAWYFGVDEAELALNVSGAADNGLKYGFKIEIQVNTDDDSGVADEARIQLSGSWGTLQLGDEDGAEDTMNYGGENLMGATGGFDGDQDDVLVRAGNFESALSVVFNGRAPGSPSIAGDTSDHTKITYYSPRFSGFQVGVSLTPQPGLDGDEFKEDGDFENHYGLGANYDNSFGSLRIRASAVYSAASSNDTWIEDVAAWSVGGIVGFGPFSIGGNYTDNSDSGEVSLFGVAPVETSYWNAAAAFETGAMKFSAGYFVGTNELPPSPGADIDIQYTHIALTADYTVAPGLGVYAEVNLIEDEIWNIDDSEVNSNDTTAVILGINASF